MQTALQAWYMIETTISDVFYCRIRAQFIGRLKDLELKYYLFSQTKYLQAEVFTLAYIEASIMYSLKVNACIKRFFPLITFYGNGKVNYYLYTTLYLRIIILFIYLTKFIDIQTCFIQNTCKKNLIKLF